MEKRRKSYSLISKFDRDGPSSLVQKAKEESRFMSFGTIVDDILSDVNIDEKYIVIDTSDKLTDSQNDIIKHILSLEDEVDVTSAYLLSIVKLLGLWNNIKDEELILKRIFSNSFIDVLIGKIEAKKEHRSFVSLENLILAKQAADSILTHKNTAWIYKTAKDIEVIKQLTIEWHNGDYKSIVDLVRIDHGKNTIYPFDLKTTSFKMNEFKKSFFEYRYYIQDAMYMDAIKEWADIHYPMYCIAEIRNILLSSQQINVPMIVEIDKTWIGIGRNSGENKYGRKIKGYIELSKEIDWHIENDLFECSKDEYETGIIKIEF